MNRVIVAKNSPAGTCGICGCTDELACADGCCWVNNAHTLCSNEICVAVAHRERELLRVIDKIIEGYPSLRLCPPSWQPGHGLVNKGISQSRFDQLVKARGKFGNLKLPSRRKAGDA